MPRVAEHKSFIVRFSGTNNVTPSTPHNKILIIYSQDVDLSGVSLGNILGVSLDLGMNRRYVQRNVERCWYLFCHFLAIFAGSVRPEDLVIVFAYQI